MKPFRAIQLACYHLVAQPVGLPFHDEIVKRLQEQENCATKNEYESKHSQDAISQIIDPPGDKAGDTPDQTDERKDYEDEYDRGERNASEGLRANQRDEQEEVEPKKRSERQPSQAIFPGEK